MKLLFFFGLSLSMNISASTYFHQDEYETVEDFNKAKSEYLEKRSNVNKCDNSMLIMYSDTRLQNAKNADAFNKKASKCIDSLKSESGFECLEADLNYFKAFRVCNLNYQQNKKNKNLSKTPLELREKCIDDAYKTRSKIFQTNKCKSYKGIRDIKTFTNPLKYTYDLTISGKSEPGNLDFIKANQKLESVNPIKQKFYKCYRQAWFDTKHETYTIDTYAKTKGCYTTMSFGSCIYNKVRQRFRCIYNRNRLNRIHPVGDMSVITDKMTPEIKSTAINNFGKAFEYADVKKTTKNYFPLYNDLNNSIENSAGKIMFTLDTDAKFVSGKIEYYIFDESNAGYIPAYDSKHKLKWVNKNQGQISWLKTGPKLKQKLESILAMSKGSVGWKYNFSDSNLYLDILGNYDTNSKQITERYLLESFQLEGYPAGIEISGKNIADSINKVATREDKNTSSNTKDSSSNQLDTESSSSSVQAAVTEFAPALSPIQIATFSPGAKKAVIVDQGSGNGVTGKDLYTFSAKRDLLLENLNSKMVKENCTSNKNDGCNKPVVLETMLKYRKEYKKLNDEVVNWEKESNVKNPETCRVLFFNNAVKK